ncbi:hypothetical protein PF005_g15914 [Phytophthora fragariae]|nr:hypothetical protein PF010_g3018 [Phytophthora fragariae]KAE9199028.1 hypothetical protein PF005_g15914 [Phytophthora fragariae]
MCFKSVARTSPDLLFAFRLFFPSEEEATRVYANYLASRQATAHGAPETEKTTALKPVSNVSWDRKRSEFFRPTSREYAEAAAKQVKIFGLTMEITTRKLEEAMSAHGYPAIDVLIKGPRRNWAEAEMRTKSQVDELLKEYGPDSSEKIRVGNHVLRFVRGENPQERLCFQCHQSGHFRNQCPELQPKPTIGQAVRGQVGHEVAPSNTDAVTVTNSEVAMRMMKNMVTQIVDERTSRLEEKLDRNMQSLAVRVDANEQRHLFAMLQTSTEGCKMLTVLMRIKDYKQKHKQQNTANRMILTARIVKKGALLVVEQRATNVEGDVTIDGNQRLSQRRHR